MRENIKSGFGLAAFFALALNTSLVSAERYSVEHDGFGNYSAKKIEAHPSTEDPLPITDNSQDSLSSEPSPATNNEQVVIEQTEEQIDNVIQAPSEEPPRKIGKFERIYLESEEAERQRILDAIKNNPNPSDYDATKVNPDDFVDSETGLRPGETLNERNSPYYISIDAEGNKQTVFYDPEEVREILFQEKNPKIKFTESTVHDAATEDIKLPENADPVALSILSPEQKKFESYFKSFSERCCSQLPSTSVQEIKVGESYFFTLTTDDLAYRFNEGDSRFLIVKLPYLGKKKIPLKIKTFIRRHADRGIEKGVFFPQVVTLDKNKKPLRIMVGPLLKFEEETWTTHAFLQGIFPVQQTAEHDERFVLINTTREALRSPSIIEMPATEDDPASTIKLVHMDVGSFQLEILQ